MPGGYTVITDQTTSGGGTTTVDAGPVWKDGRATTIMPIGDSITRGQGGESIGGYRGPLRDLLTGAGLPFRLVGWHGDVKPPGYWAVGGWRISDSAGWGDRNGLAWSGVDDVRAGSWHDALTGVAA